MGYVDISPPGIASASVKRAFTASLNEGLDYSSDGIANESAKAAAIKNMWLMNGVLTSRGRLYDTDIVLEGSKVHSSVYCFGYEFIHCGSSLYATDGSECRLLYSQIPDANSFFAEFSGKLYLYCSTFVFSVDKELCFKEELPYCPVYENVCSREHGSIVREDEITPNILAPVVRARYGSSDSNPTNRYRFPDNMDMTRSFYLYYGDELIDSSKYTVEGRYFYLSDEVMPKNGIAISIAFYSTHKVFEKCGIISGCTTAASFGGNAQGTRIICGGNPDYPGRYFLSEVANPLYFLEDSYGTAGNGHEDITAFSKQHSELLIFTDSTVSRMRYNYTSDEGGYYSVHLINPTVGCDMPGSVCTVDNRTVFANSKGGIYIVDSTDGYDEMNILPISGNITDASGKNGYFSVPIQERKNGFAFIYGGRYMLCAGDKVFIWDSAESPYISSSDYGKAEKRLCWFEFDGFEDVCLLFSCENELFALKKKEDGVCSVCGFGKKGEKCTYLYRSAVSDLGYSGRMKYLLSFGFDAKVKDKTEASVKFYADGKPYARIKAELIPDGDGYARFFARLPKYSARHFVFEIECSDADTGIINAENEYIIRKENCNFAN